MIDQWFNRDIEKVLTEKDRLVVIDETVRARFLVDLVAGQFPVLFANDEIGELKTKYEIEKEYKNKKVIIYTNTSKNKLKFLREYCETDGCIEIRHFHHYVKDKVQQSLGLNISLEGEELITAAIISVGKDKNYWIDLVHKGTAEMFSTESDIIPFLSDPESFTGKLDKTVKELLFKHLNSILERDYIEQPALTLAKEFTETILRGLLEKNISEKLLTIYHKWLDTISYREAIIRNIKKFKLPPSINIWAVHPDHPFEKVDQVWLKEIGEHFGEKIWISEKLPLIEQRSRNKIAGQTGADYWQDIIKLIGFKGEGVDKVGSLKEVCECYIKEFVHVDAAIRAIYTRFLNQKELLVPFQEYYQGMIRYLYQKWFEYIDQYQPGQQGLLKEIIIKNKTKTVIIVGDGITWEIAQQVVQNLKQDFDLVEHYVLAGFPSTTENNMSLMYTGTDTIENIQQKRQDKLKEAVKEEVIFLSLDEIKGGIFTPQYLVCSYKDIDSLGEKLQQETLKYFPEMIKDLTEKIRILLDGGYRNVFLVSDHGFVLTGMLSESEKVEVKPKGDILKAERYVRTIDKQAWGDFFVEKEQKYDAYNYVYFAKTANPFKTPGKYGYSHGGLTPQEIIVPFIRFSVRQEQVEKLCVHIANKDQLMNVTGQIYHILLKAEQGAVDLFTSERKVFLVFFSGGIQVNQSDIITISAEKQHGKDYSFEKHTSLEVLLLDAETREQLDRAVISKSFARDLGGL